MGESSVWPKETLDPVKPQRRPLATNARKVLILASCLAVVCLVMIAVLPAAAPHLKAFRVALAVSSVAAVLFLTLNVLSGSASAPEPINLSCPDTHVVRDQQCVLREDPVRSGGDAYTIDSSADVPLCVGQACSDRYTPISSVHHLNASEVKQMCDAFKDTPYAQLNELGSACSRHSGM